MLNNHVAVEAIYSATYLENYLYSVENLPNDLQRHISRMRQLDVDFQGNAYRFTNDKQVIRWFNLSTLIFTAILRDIERYTDVLQGGPDGSDSAAEDRAAASGSNAGHWRKRLLQKLQSSLISSLEIGDEKLQLVQSVQDVVENKSRQLESDCKALGKKSFFSYFLWWHLLMKFCFSRIQQRQRIIRTHS